MVEYSGMNKMVCGQPSSLVLEVNVPAGEDSLTFLRLAFLLLTVSKLSSDESSPVTEYSSVYSLVLEQVLCFREELANVDIWLVSAAEDSASTASDHHHWAHRF
ncbi:hypothetical protein MTO96_027587 [Rhipicephalus appendiculatus]